MDQSPPPLVSPEMDDEINLIDLIYTIFMHRKFLVIFCLVVVIATGLITWRLPKVYEATVVSLPEVKKDGGNELQAAFLEKFGVAGLVGSSEAPSEIFQTILKSEELARKTAKRSASYFRSNMSPDNERKLVEEILESIIVTKSITEPTLSLSVKADDPYLAADLANSYLVELDFYNIDSDITSAQRLRKYIEKRLQTANEELEQAQNDMRSFQEKNNAISISEQSRATIEVLSQMEAKRVLLDVEKDTIEKFYKGSSVELERINAELAALRRNIDRLTASTEDTVPLTIQEGRVEFYIPLTRIPSLNFDERRLLLNFTAKTGVVTMLTNQLEQVKLDETKDTPTINVLDWAEPNIRPVKPKLMLIVVLSGVVAFFTAILMILIVEHVRRMQDDSEMSPKLKEIKEALVPKKLRSGKKAVSQTLTSDL